ncbi:MULTISPECIES: ectoine hydroxylase [Bradyrhizobium]|uniref:Ectoine hydroxylase n=1 Tax=Bradyrhizobium brasilense TaxID=1419277 RepID=A0ABY8JKL4_9BRAD|nr:MULTISPECIES: ectoine hydroxylase [Bradyrhizobium]MCP1829774.1 ectoine hydroxylase [Bradyrhizobium sp. USDA 4545]MCP1848418.1 ectoine hydroxylase [Bradyrhizobium sp. USDA 4541]MCP1922883.1 ectoine hydroxylase [Bradyrhizobium sp. USDA 4532]WFU64936.1 ectoine hydroxylase [Bradyrhizobium brasilense]
MLPRLDPVIHSDWSESAPLTRQQAEQFDRDGFLVLKDVLSPEEVDHLQTQAKKLLSSPNGLNPETIIAEPDSQEIRSVFEIHSQSRVIGRLAADARLSGIAQFLLNDKVYIHQSRLNYKPGFEGKEFYWHSDFETWHVEDGMPRMRALSMSVLLAENTPDNGPLMLMPGSHRVFLTCIGATPEDHYRTSLKKQEYGVPDRQSLTELAHRHGIVAPTGKAGTVVIFDCNTMHGSNGNITPFPRANAFFVYNAVSNRLQAPFGVKKPRPSFVAARSDPKALVPQHGPLMEDALA